MLDAVIERLFKIDPAQEIPDVRSFVSAARSDFSQEKDSFPSDYPSLYSRGASCLSLATDGIREKKFNPRREIEM